MATTATAAAPAGPPQGADDPGGQSQVAGRRTIAEPFGLTFLSRGRPVTAEASGAVAGPGGRLAYQVGGSVSSQQGATYHRLTSLIARRPVTGGTAYTVAT